MTIESYVKMPLTLYVVVYTLQKILVYLNLNKECKTCTISGFLDYLYNYT